MWPSAVVESLRKLNEACDRYSKASSWQSSRIDSFGSDVRFAFRDFVKLVMEEMEDIKNED